nr:sulfurtransferase TusA family protein [Fusobacteriaceae bacterium]
MDKIIKVDAIGDKCPLPVIKTKNALKEIESGVLEVLVDNEISMENVEKMCLEKKLSYSIVKDNNIYKISIIKSEDNKKKNSEDDTLGTVIVIDSDEM